MFDLTRFILTFIDLVRPYSAFFEKFGRVRRYSFLFDQVVIIWSNLALFDPIWPYLIQFGLILIQFGLFWSNLALFDPIWPYLIQFGLIWSNWTLFDQIWPYLIQFGLIWTNWALFYPIWPYLVQFGLIWSNSDLLGLIELIRPINNTFTINGHELFMLRRRRISVY